MSSITSWTRLEPRARTGDLRPSLEGQVHDPAWMLARQWQLGEFLGDDAGSPVWVRVRGHADRITAYRPGPASGPGTPYDGTTPLEALVEAEPGGPRSTTGDLRAGAEAGQHLLRLLRAAVPADRVAEALPLLLDDYPLGLLDTATADPATHRYLSVLRGRVPDGHGIAYSLHASPVPSDEPGWGLPPEAGPVLSTWLAWYDARHLTAPEGPQTWDPQRLEHRFSLGVKIGVKGDGHETTLIAPAYQGGTLDWTDFTMTGPTGLAPTPDREPLLSTTFPAPVTFPGMPARRYWEFEDARVALGGVEAAPSDLARMVVAEFATVYGNDWYLVPLDVPVGSFTTLTSVVVGDTFSSALGGPTLLPAPGTGRGDAHWSLHCLSTVHGTRGAGLFVPPMTVGTLESEPIEEVLLARDEDANQAWAVERRVPTPIGTPLDRTRITPTAPAPPEALTYRLRTDVPDHWLPLLPIELHPGAHRLRLAHLDTPDGIPVLPLGRFLNPGPPTPYDLYTEEVPREGITLTRTVQYARTSDGRTVTWTSRRARPGRGGTSSGLRFDQMEG
ncbi:hypothetical protein AB0D49_29385 [Streptomyces sp. NPDC048290]|uniref:hypothetical protein n=1 Tax=Streptomyces sp. NPDC048290 TaxID=3155811 RepID=UPI00343C3892